MGIIQKTDRKINIVGIDDPELTGLEVVTAAALFDTQNGPVIGIFHEYAHLGKGRSIQAVGQMEWFNCKVDDRLKLEVPRELKPLMDMCSHFPSNLVWFTCMMTISNIPMSFLHHQTFGMLMFWTMAFNLPFLRKFTEKLMMLCSKILCLMNLGIFVVQHLEFFWDSSPAETGEHTFHAHLHQTNPVEKIGNHSGFLFDGNLNRSSRHLQGHLTVWRYCPST